MSRANQWFVPGDGIAREVITADIQRYLGPDALVRPGVGNGEYQGQPGYWITAYRTLTSQMIQDLKMDSQRWQQERQPGETGRGGSHSPYVRDTKVSRGPDASLVAYQDSRTHAARQHWGPTKPYDQHAAADPYEQPPRQAASSRTPYAASTGYASSDAHYTTTPTAAYGTSGYQAVPASAAPRTQPADPYSAYQQPSRDTRDYATQQSYSSYPVQSTTDPYGRQTAPPTPQYAAPSTTAAPGYYIASDGRQYPLSQQPQSSRNPQSGASRYSSQR
ncbi:Nn.00g106110.m01.CDS01 [Neocucurbitaria sp. VM-36]